MIIKGSRPHLLLIKSHPKVDVIHKKSRISEEEKVLYLEPPILAKMLKQVF